MKKLLFILFVFVAMTSNAQEWSALDGITTQYEIQISASDNKTPLWLNANKYGLSSLSKSNGYVRAAAFRDIRRDADRNFGVGYGIDFAVPYNYDTKVALQQLYAEMRLYMFTLSFGSKYHPMEFKNQRLSSGGQALGINARPVPQARIAIDDYWAVPYTRGWFSFKGHLSYGYMTDGKWQRDFTAKQKSWTEGVLYHSKAGYFKIGRDDRPFSFEFALEMATQFGGEINWYEKPDKLVTFKAGEGLSSFWHAFIPGGSDYKEDEVGYKNVEGNQLGSWLFRLKYRHQNFDITLYADKFFEDHSSLYNLGYAGYGKDGQWDKRSRKLYAYPMKDGLLGVELNLKRQNYVKTVVAEFINTRYQSGPVYHDHSETIFDQIGGMDEFYNHKYYAGWQYYGQVIGNPLYLSPIYNEDGELRVKDNRFFAWHFGIEGNILPELSYRVLASWQKGYGTYKLPYDNPAENTSILLEAEYDLSKKCTGMHVRAGYGLDRGGLLGNNNGFQLSLLYNL